MSDYRFGIGEHNGVECLHVMIDAEPIAETHIPLDDIQRIMINGERYNAHQLRAFRNMWQAIVKTDGHIPEMTPEQESVARYLKLYPPSKVVDVEIDGKQYRGTVYLVEG